MKQIERYRIDIPQPELDTLRERVRSARWPQEETVEDWSQGIPVSVVRDLCDYWATRYDWRATEARLNELPNYVCRIDGLDIHFIHVESANPDSVPLIITHGWPGTILEFEQLIPPLTDPQAGISFPLVIPSLPGYGFSDPPTGPGWGVERIADTWAELMTRLGYDTFGAAGSDWGTSISTMLGLRHPDRILGIHLMPPLAPPDHSLPTTAEEQRALDDLADRGSAYSAVHAETPQTIGYALADSPTGLCAWIAEKYWKWTDHDGELYTVINRDRVLDCVSIYWHTQTAATSIRLYWESFREVEAWISEYSDQVIEVPTGCSILPAEVPRTSRRWANRRFSDIRYWAEHDRGGHFAALEHPDAVVNDIRSFFGPLTTAD